MPESFADIPPASDVGGLRTSVAGTPEAVDAVLDAQVPQTAAIKRSEADEDLKEARAATIRANDVFADCDGNVARNVQDQSETRENLQWKQDNLSAENRERAAAAAQNVSPETLERACSAAQNATPETRERVSSAAQNRVAATPASSSASRQVSNRADLNRSYEARQRGATRQASRPQTMRAPARQL